MADTGPGYWDVDRCAWVGVDPTYVVPPAHTGRQAPARACPPPPADPAGSGVPRPRERVGRDEPVS